MAEHPIAVEVVTPEEALFAGPATAVVASTSEGDLTVMAGHAELIGDLVPGLVRIEPVEGDPQSIVIHGGFIQVHSGPGAAGGLVDEAGEGDRTTRATLLVGIAERSSEIDIPRAEAARARAEERLAELRQQSGRGSEAEETRDAYVELAEAEAALARAELRLATASPLGMH
jgi:F-type H+-transporting ATPase subunit epsilon